MQLSVKNLLYKWWISLDIDAFECSSVSTYLRHSLSRSLTADISLVDASEWVCCLYTDHVCMCFSFLCCVWAHILIGCCLESVPRALSGDVCASAVAAAAVANTLYIYTETYSCVEREREILNEIKSIKINIFHHKPYFMCSSSLSFLFLTYSLAEYTPIFALGPACRPIKINAFEHLKHFILHTHIHTFIFNIHTHTKKSEMINARK